MCDQDHFDEDVKKYSRRDLGVMVSAGIGASLFFPKSAFAVDVTENEVEIKTPDGVCDAYFVTPKDGAHAAVIVWPDIFGLRPAFRQMGKRLAESGYSVLVVNPFYRSKKAPVAKDASTHTDSRCVSISAWSERNDAQRRCQSIRRVARCPAADGQEKEDRYDRLLHGGPIVMRTAAAVPERIGAGGHFMVADS